MYFLSCVEYRKVHFCTSTNKSLLIHFSLSLSLWFTIGKILMEYLIILNRENIHVLIQYYFMRNGNNVSFNSLPVIPQGAAAIYYMVVTSFLTSVYMCTRPDDHDVRQGSFDIPPRQTCDSLDNAGDPRVTDCHLFLAIFPFLSSIPRPASNPARRNPYSSPLHLSRTPLPSPISNSNTGNFSQGGS